MIFSVLFWLILRQLYKVSSMYYICLSHFILFYFILQQQPKRSRKVTLSLASIILPLGRHTSKRWGREWDGERGRETKVIPTFLLLSNPASILSLFFFLSFIFFLLPFVFLSTLLFFTLLYFISNLVSFYTT